MTWSLERAAGRLSEQCLVQHFFVFSFWALGDQSELSKMFLLTCLISIYTLRPTGTSFGLNLDLVLLIELNFWKMFKNADFFETCFSQENEVGLRMYTDYVISKNGFD